jgi:hypothetical protein
MLDAAGATVLRVARTADKLDDVTASIDVGPSPTPPT